MWSPWRLRALARAWLSPLLLHQPEVNFYLRRDTHRNTVFHSGLELPLAQCLHSLLIEAKPDWACDSDITNQPLALDDYAQQDRSLELRQPCFPAVLRFHFRKHSWRGNITSHAKR